MPTYVYACTNPDCGHQFEAVQAFTDDALTVCPVCGQRLRKVFGSVGVVFKGSGFYRNDSREKTGGSAKASSGANGGEGKTTTAKSEESSSAANASAKSEGSKSGSDKSNSSKSDSSKSDSSKSDGRSTNGASAGSRSESSSSGGGSSNSAAKSNTSSRSSSD